VRSLLIMTGTGSLFGGFFSALYIAFILRELELGPVLLGIGIATGGVGAMAGSFMAQPMARRLGVGPTICVSGARRIRSAPRRRWSCRSSWATPSEWFP
jgi:hypothetical protein